MCVKWTKGVKVEAERLLQDAVIEVWVRDDGGLYWGGSN